MEKLGVTCMTSKSYHGFKHMEALQNRTGSIWCSVGVDASQREASGQPWGISCRQSCCWRMLRNSRQPEATATRVMSDTQTAIIELADDDEWRYFIATANIASATPSPPPATLQELFFQEARQQAKTPPQQEVVY